MENKFEKLNLITGDKQTIILDNDFDCVAGWLNDCVLRRFTGLHDKNGKEIYEGDIVEFVGGTCNYLPCGIYEYHKYIIGNKMIVQKLLSGFTLAGLNMVNCEISNRVGKVDNYTFWNHQRSLQIIGNIHQNQELLNNG